MDKEKAHQYFSADCFNSTWGYLDKAERTAEEDLEMIHCAHASMYHWLQREDCKPLNLSIGLWQLSRVYVTIGDVVSATRYAEQCEAISRENETGAFSIGFALEARARAAALAGERDAADRLVAEARDLAEKIEDPGDKKLLLDDLVTV